MTFAAEKAMKFRRSHLASFLSASLLILSPGFSQTLKIATANIWSGLDYRGLLTMGEYESRDVHEKRFSLLTEELKSLRPDVIALQEVNLVSKLACELAKIREYDVIYQRVNGGVKVGPVGYPSNLNEGLVILAKKELHLEFVDVWDLSAGFGIFGDAASFHFSDRNAALVGKIRVGNCDVYIANVQLSSVVPDDSTTRTVAREIVTRRKAQTERIPRAVEDCFSDAERRKKSVELLSETLRERYAGKPFVILGDFNAAPTQEEIRYFTGSGFLDAAKAVGMDDVVTWDAEKNTNVRYSVQPRDAQGNMLDTYGLLSAWYDGKSRRIDYVFLNDLFDMTDVLEVDRILDNPVDSLYASDHYGLLATIDLSRLTALNGIGESTAISTQGSKFEALPILSYDTDVGFGYGAKAFFLDFLDLTESLDLVAFNSTKGERWYRLAFSMPDFELRQGKIYPLSFDLTVDYDKYLKNNFYGVGSGSRRGDRETYTKEPLEISAVFSRGFSERFVGQIGLKYRTVRNFNYDSQGLFGSSLADINHGRSSAATLYASARFDSRDSYINPSRGQVVQAEFETGGSWLAGDYSITSTTLALQTYHVLFYPKTVFAGRLLGQIVSGTDIPVHALATMGGTRTLRGYPQDRFLDETAAVLNAEIRFPIYWRFGGIVGLDAGRVFRSPSATTLHRWAMNSVVGLRLYMDTFVVRADLGFGRETTGFYLNFGHLF
jgi:endonuclease/exonuclease/phosphatase family metal-dependent hydrolase